MEKIRTSSDVKTISDDGAKSVVEALKSDGRATMAAAIFGKKPEFRGPETVPPIEAAVKDRVSLKEAEASGLMRRAKSCGWGLYNVADIDGGLGSIWYLEKDAETGEQYLVKQTDEAGDIVRRVKAAQEPKP